MLSALALPTGSSLAFWQAPRKSKSPPVNCKLLILPGFGNDSMDYMIPNSLVDSLKKRGWQEDQICVLPVERLDWLKVFLRGALDLDFWRSNAPPTKPAFSWYLERIAAEIKEVKHDERIILLGHSAGGWLGRAALGFGSNDKEALSFVDINKVLGIVTLGAPNLPPPPGVMDMTRGALRITNEKFPGSFHAPSTFYVTVIGNAIQGRKQERKSALEPSTIAGFAFNSYEAVCGNGTTFGDGVVPLCSGHVSDAIQLTLDGVLHSINAPDSWYGSDNILDQWHDTMLVEIERMQTPAKGGFQLSRIFQ